MGSRFMLLCCSSLGLLVMACLGKTRAQLNTDKAARALVAPVATQVVTGSVRRADGVELTTSSGVLRVSAPRADTFRLQWAEATDQHPLPSWAVEHGAPGAGAATVEESRSLILVRTARALLRIDKRPLRVTLMAADGRVIAEQVASARFEQGGVGLDFGLARGERVFGLGDKARGFDRRGHAFELWNTDAYGWKVDSDPLYKSIPMWLSLRSGRAHGVFIDHPARARVDVGRAQPDVLRYETSPARALDVYLFAGPEPRHVLEAYTALTGRTPLPPLWALGHHQSRYGYLSEQEVRGVVTRMQNEKIPLDAIWLDIDFQQDNAPFTVNQRAFPHFREMIADFARAGVAIVVITDLHVKSFQGKPATGYAPYEEGAAGDHFIRAGGAFYEAPVWPGPSVFPEFTRAATRHWWGELYRDFIERGVAGFWNDMNEPAVFLKDKTFPETLQHRLDDGSRVSHALIHNVYGSLNARATYEGVRRLRPDERPFVLTRAAYAGVQRYAASWTGDNTADRAHLAATIPNLLNLGISGFPFNGADVGGFVGCPDAELFATWMELGALQPFFRNHAEKQSCRREPWLFGAAALTRARRAVERRYELLPYLYTLFEESARTGAPIMRPLWYQYPENEKVADVSDAYLLGRDLLVAAKLTAGTSAHRITLPAGWYDVQTSRLLPAGEHARSSSEGVWLFARAGAIVPRGPVSASARVQPRGVLSLEVWPAPECEGSLYVDDGKSFAYLEGAFRRVSYRCELAPGGFTLSARSQGVFEPWWQSVRVIVRATRAPRAVTDAAGNPLQHAYDPSTRTLTIEWPGPITDSDLRARWTE